MTDTEKAKALLEATEHSYKGCAFCRNARPYPDAATEEAHVRAVRATEMAHNAIRRLGFNKRDTLRVATLGFEALKGRCWHQELYEERSDGASDIYPDIMHKGKCGEATTCEPCSACKALAAWEKL